MSRFEDNLMRVGIVIGLWIGIGITAINGTAHACLLAAILTVFTAGLVAWDARKAWKRYRGDRP